MRVWYTVSYDISNNKQRRIIEKTCKKYLQRVQYSVFEGYLSSSRYQELKQDLTNNLCSHDFDQRIDSVIIWKQCAICRVDKITLGKQANFTEHALIL